MEYQYVPASPSNYETNAVDYVSLNPGAQSGTPFCEALFFFYDCGCRSRDPVICCRARQLPGDLSCQHEKPTLVVARIPHACKAGSPSEYNPGESDRCRAEDPGAKQFAREVDTAERLELLVLDDCARADLDAALPARVDAPFTLVDVLHRRNEIMNRGSGGLRPTAVEFVPSFMVPSSSPVVKEIIDVVQGSRNEPTEDIVGTEDDTNGDEGGQLDVECAVPTPGHLPDEDDELELTTPDTTPDESISEEEPTSEEILTSDEDPISEEESASEESALEEEPTSEAPTPEEVPTPEGPINPHDDMILIWQLQDAMAEQEAAAKSSGLTSFFGGIFGWNSGKK
ncbi:hypothetical protein F4861DRAFT_539403 [Xylaria intraflava]|nr:hypothetical protein F4861DRAFT_539403 [Xylaria intraflava]